MKFSFEFIVVWPVLLFWFCLGISWSDSCVVYMVCELYRRTWSTVLVLVLFWWYELDSYLGFRLGIGNGDSIVVVSWFDYVS